MMRFGIPEYRLPRTLIRAEIDKILSLGVTLKLGTPLSASFGLAELRQRGLRGGLPLGRRDEGARARRAGRRARRRRQGRRLPPQRQPGLPHRPRPPRGGHRRRLRGLRRRAHRAAPRPGRRARPRGPRLRGRRPREGGPRLRPRRAPRRRHRGDDRLPRALRRDAGRSGRTQGHEEFEETKREGVAFLPRRGPKRFVGNGGSPPSSCAASYRSSMRTAASPRPTTTRTWSPSRPTPASWPSARSRTCRS